MKEISVNTSELHNIGMSISEISMELADVSLELRGIFDMLRCYIPAEYDNAFSAYSMLRQICEQSEAIGKSVVVIAQMYYECEKIISDSIDDIYLP